VSNLVLSHTIKQFAANNLGLHLDKMNTMKFIRKNSSHSALHIGYKYEYTEETLNTTLLGIQTDNHINCKNQTEQMIPKLSAACYAIRLMVCNSNINTLKSIYYAYFNSIIKYGILFWVTLPTVGRRSFYKRKSSELQLMHRPEPLVEAYLHN